LHYSTHGRHRCCCLVSFFVSRCRLRVALTPATSRANWADDDEFEDHTALPSQQIISNADGTKTVITYKLSDAGKKVKITRRIRSTVHTEHVNPRVAERKSWSKFGKEAGHAAGPDLSTTSVGENIVFRPSTNWKATRGEEESPENKSIADRLKHKQIACRICKGDHFTSKCPFRDTLPALEDAAAATTPEPEPVEQKAGGAYVAPHLRGKGRGAGESMAGGGGRDRDRDDLATLRVTNLTEFADEGELRDMFERFGRVTRVFLARDRETNRAKGFAFVSYADRADAERACAKMDGFGYAHLILRVEFAKKSAA
jgi:translation initiation factor 3 subunit G